MDSTTEPSHEYTTSEEDSTHTTRPYLVQRLRLLMAGIAILFSVGVVSVLFLNANSGYESTSIVVEKGVTAADVAATAYQAGVVRSELFFYLALIVAGDPSTIQAGEYPIASDLSSLEIANIILTETPQEPLATVTLPEGISVTEMAAIFVESLPNFDASAFIALAKDNEGYLWPETYFVPYEYTATEAYNLLVKTAREAHEEIFTNYTSNLTEAELIILASIVEREANTPESMRMVAGVLLQRLEIGMALQADATIEYALESKIGELPAGQLATELREFDTPYNSYLYPGLPPTPIGNPGREALLAVLAPAENAYLYYITDNEGNFHYAETYAEHLENVNRYLR